MKYLISILVLVILFVGSIDAGEDIVVEVPEFDIVINGEVIANKREVYPIVQSRGITYLPLTYDMSQALGLSTKWTNETGLVIEHSKNTLKYLSNGNGNHVPGTLFRASIASFPITVNGEKLSNYQEVYPLLVINDITYFPLTYRFMVDSFGLSYDFTEEKGLELSSIGSKQSASLKDKHLDFKFEVSKLKDNIYFLNEFLELDFSDNKNLKVRVFNQNKSNQYEGYYLNADVVFYGEEEQILFTKHLFAGSPQAFPTEYIKSQNIRVTNDIKSIQFKLDFISQSNFEKSLSQLKRNVKAIVTTSDAINIVDLKTLGGKKISVRTRRYNGVNKSMTDDEYIYSAFLLEADYSGNEIALEQYLIDSDPYGLSVYLEPYSLNNIDLLHFDNESWHNQIYGTYEGVELITFKGSNIYLYDEEKRLVAIVVVSDLHN